MVVLSQVPVCIVVLCCSGCPHVPGPRPHWALQRSALGVSGQDKAKAQLSYQRCTCNLENSSLPAVSFGRKYMKKRTRQWKNSERIKQGQIRGYLYIGKYPPPPSGGGGGYQLMSFGGKIWKGEEKKGENVNEKGRKSNEKERKRKQKEKGEVKG